VNELADLLEQMPTAWAVVRTYDRWLVVHLNPGLVPGPDCVVLAEHDQLPLALRAALRAELDRQADVLP
jgi:hypothetical protein